MSDLTNGQPFTNELPESNTGKAPERPGGAQAAASDGGLVGPGPSSLRPPGSEQGPPPFPIPAVPLPVTLFYGMVKTTEGDPVIILTAVNDAGSMTSGVLMPEYAAKVGRDLLGLSRQAALNAPKRLLVPESGLAVPR